ncbi:rab family gtpase [Nannochloropsis gaditana]|uniref:Rab family gtpase n=1 Tax=Nannochloropsis gaditana TaxID=72520 RepID=W7U9Z1_9STRA|nr:rab family gtpase [Nannochloropsis gaditana]
MEDMSPHLTTRATTSVAPSLQSSPRDSKVKSRNRGSGKRTAGLSQKTLNIVNNLQPAPATFSKERDDEEEERLLAMEEKRRQVAAGSDPSSSLPSSVVEYTEFMSIRILLLGDSGVGKTSLMMRYSENEFAPCLLSTAGVDFKVRHLTLEESKRKVKVQIWDTAGQERMHVITRTYYKGSHGIALVYNLTDPDSFRNVNYWMANIQQHAGDKVVKTLIGNKADLTDRAISYEQGAAMAKEYGFMHFFETSAKSGANVHGAFNALALDIVRRIEEAQNESVVAAFGNGGLGNNPKKQCVID